MQKPLNESDASNVAALAAGQLGEDPNAAPAAPVEQPPADTTLDKVSEAGAPTTDADKQDQPPIKYSIKFGEEDRELTPEQISGTFDRYSKMNEFQNSMRPVLNLAAQAMKANPGMTPQAFAQSLVAMANKHNPEMGGRDETPNANTNAKPDGAADISAQLDQWEKDNAATLPPGYKDMLSGASNSQGQMQQMMHMMQQVLGRSQGLNDAGKQAAASANNQSVTNAKQRIANNLAAVQQKLGLPDEAEQDFMIFASERGFTMEDFLDPVLAMKVATDFKNGTQSGEVDRLKAVAARRQAFTGSAPTQPGAVPGVTPGTDQNLENLVSRKMG